MKAQPKRKGRTLRSTGNTMPRRDAKLLNVPEETRLRVQQWHKEEGMPACLRHIKEELGITISESAAYDTFGKWRTREVFASYYERARETVENEANVKDLTPEQVEEAVDRNFIMLAVDDKNVEMYMQLRKLRIADQRAKRQNRVAETKLKQGAKALKQKDKALQLAERRVTLLGQKIEEAKKATQSETLSAEERAQRVREILGD